VNTEQYRAIRIGEINVGNTRNNETHIENKASCPQGYKGMNAVRGRGAENKEVMDTKIEISNIQMVYRLARQYSIKHGARN